MSWPRLLAGYAWAIGVREWSHWGRVRPEVRASAVVAAGVVIAPFVAFVGPVARLYWLVSGPRPGEQLVSEVLAGRLLLGDELQ